MELKIKKGDVVRFIGNPELHGRSVILRHYKEKKTPLLIHDTNGTQFIVREESDGFKWEWLFTEIELVKVCIEIENENNEKENKKIMGIETKSLEEAICEGVMPFLKKKMEKEYKDLCKGVTTVVVKLDEEEIKKTTVQTHEQFKNVLTLVSNKIPAMLTGPAGSGKSSTCEKIAEVLGLDFYFSNAITQEYKLTGFIDAEGKYQETQFYKAFKNGGLFVLDEIDASVPEALVILNTAIANGYFDFPNGKVEAHKNFRVVACANTYGLGCNDVYVGRYQLDGASLDRFAVVEFDYDEDLEQKLVENVEWCKFIQALRKRIKAKGLKHILSMRATIYGDKLLKTDMNVTEIMRQVVLKNLKTDDIKTIGDLSISNQYATIYNNAIKNGVF